MKRKEAPVYIWHWFLIFVGIAAALVIRNRLKESGAIEPIHEQVFGNVCDNRFTAILYPRIGRDTESDSMSKSLFLEHMTELKSSGHYTVGLEQICDFYKSNGLLPEKTIAIILDGSRDTCLNAVPIIEELGLRATVMLDVEAMRKKSRSFMSWHDLANLQRKRFLNFALRAAGTGDLHEQLDYLEKRLPDLRVCGISAPIDPGQATSLSCGNTVTFSLEDGDGFNSNNTDSSRLNLLRIEPQLSGHELVGLLSNISSQTQRIENGFTEESRRLNWISTCGDVRIVDGMLELTAEPSRSSADTWSFGIHDWSDVDLTVKFEVTGGEQFWTYLRYRNDDSFIRLGCDGERTLLQQKVAGKQLKNLKVARFDHKSSNLHTLRVILRGRFATAFVDDRRLSERPLRIDNSLVSGKIGFAIWDPACGVAGCRISGVFIRKLPCIALMNMDWYRDSPDWINDHADHFSYLCPNGLSLDATHAEQNIDDYNALLISAAYKGYILAPTVALDEKVLETNGSVVTANKITDLLTKNRLESIHLDCRQIRVGKASVELGQTLATLKAKLPGTGLMLSLSRQCFQSCEDILELADILIVRLDGQQSNILNEVARPFRLKTLLRTQIEDPSKLIDGLLSDEDNKSTDNSRSDAGYVVQNYELKGIAL